MDEKTVRVVLQIPEDMVGFLERLARREGFKSRSRAIRWCIREEMKREKEDQEEAEWLRKDDEEVDERSGRFAFEGDEGPDDIEETPDNG